MTRLAHLSDLHLLEETCNRRRGLARYRLTYLSAGVPHDPAGRRRRAAAALAHAAAAKADHVLLTGDLTEDGTPEQFELLRELLEASGFLPEQITLVPGNHDTYSDPLAWDNALSGPLRPYRVTSARGAVSVLPGVVIKPISSVIEKQSFAFSLGAIRREDVTDAARLVDDPISRGRCTVLAMHHPPLGLSNPLLNVVDGVRGCKPMRALLRERANLRVAHGHIHRRVDRRIGNRTHAQIFATHAARDGEDPMRLYRADGGELVAEHTGAPDGTPVEAGPELPRAAE